MADAVIESDARHRSVNPSTTRRWGWTNFALAMKSKIEELMVDRMDQNQEIVTRYLNDPQFQNVAIRLLSRKI